MKRGFGYNIIQILSLERLKEFRLHKRLRVFYHKGVKCVTCGIEGTFLMSGEDKRKSLHWDVYCEDGTGMTIDHIIPKSKGGSDELANLQPMCQNCNSEKSNSFTEQDLQNGHIDKNFVSRKKCVKKKKKSNENYVENCKFNDITFTVGDECIHLHTKGLLGKITKINKTLCGANVFFGDKKYKISKILKQ